MSQAAPDRVPVQPLRGSFSWLGYLVYAIIALRSLMYAPKNNSILPHSLFLLGILALLISASFVFRYFRAYRWLYFLLQALLIQGFGLLLPHQDIWGLLYYVLCVQAYNMLPSPWPLGLGVIFSITYMATMIATTGIQAGLAYGLNILTGAVLLASAEIVNLQLKQAQRESLRLVAALQEATSQLEQQAAQAEKLAAAREHNRLVRQLHDSIGQTIFSIDLMAQAIHLLIKKDPDRVGEQLKELEAATVSALAQMRSLIKQWYPPARS